MDRRIAWMHGRAAAAMFVSALLLGPAVGLSQPFTMTNIPTIPHTLGSTVSTDSRALYTVSQNNVIAILDVSLNPLTGTFTDSFTGYINLTGHCVNPSGIAFCNGKLYVESYSNIVIIDLAASSSSQITEMTQPFALGDQGGSVATSPDGHYVYAITGTSDSLSIIDSTTDERVALVPVGRSNTNLSLSPDGTRAYLLNSLSAGLTIVDLTTNQVSRVTSFTGDRPFTNFPVDSAMRSDGTLFVSWVDPAYFAHVSLIDRDGNVFRVIDTPYFSTGMALSVDEQLVVLGNGYVVDANDGHEISQLPRQYGLSKVTFSPNGQRAFVTNELLQSVMTVTGFRPTLTMSGTAGMGQTVTLQILDPGQAGKLYQVAASSGMSAGIPLSYGRLFPLDRDALFQYSVQRVADGCTNFTGHLGADGSASASLRLSLALPGTAIGRTIYVAYGTFSGERRRITEVAAISNVVPITLHQ